MISIQLADLFQTYIGASEKPSSELIEKYGRATTAIANTFTIKVTEDDEKYLYLRYKKIKNDTSILEFIRRPYLIYYFYFSLFGYDVSQLMEQYICKVEQLGVDVDSGSGKKSGFVKGPSKMQNNSDSTISDDEFSTKRTQLVDCIREGNLANVCELLSADSQLVNLPYLDLYPIHVASDVGKLDILKELVNYGANIDQKDGDGQTALHYAACNGYLDAVSFLINSGIDTKIRCNENATAFDLATDPEIIDLLKPVT